jgi:hypothetical protein
MKLTGTVTETKRVEMTVTFWEALGVVMREAYARAGIPSGGQFAIYMQNGQIVTDVEEWYGAHSAFETKVLVERPTTEQVMVIETFQHLYELMRKFEKE